MAKNSGKIGKDEKDKDNDNKLTLTVVVNGQPAEVTTNVNAPLHTVIPEALTKTGNVGQPPENWELKDANGAALELSKNISEFGFTRETKLFLSLKAGVAGCH